MPSSSFLFAQIMFTTFYIFFRDLGELIRKRVSEGFPQGETSTVDITKWTKFSSHLENIANNQSLKQHPRSLTSNATGLSVEECREIVSTDFMNLMKQNQKA